jgi:hypothetical protein
MAGIGWKLEDMISRDSLAGAVAAYLTGVAVTSTPWLLTTAALVSMHVLARDHAGDGEFLHVEHIVTITYAVTLVLSAPVHVVLSRYTADRLYEQRVAAVSASLRAVLAATMLGFLVVGLVITAMFAVPLLEQIAQVSTPAHTPSTVPAAIAEKLHFGQLVMGETPGIGGVSPPVEAQEPGQGQGEEGHGDGPRQGVEPAAQVGPVPVTTGGRRPWPGPRPSGGPRPHRTRRRRR